MKESICSNPDVLSVMNILNNIITIIKVLVPVLIIITGVMSLAKAVMSEDDKLLKSSVQTFITKFFVGATIFFIPAIFGAFFSLVAPDMEYMDCFEKAKPQNINKAYLDIAMNRVALAEKTIDEDDYSSAYMAVLKLKDDTAKKNLLNRLDKVKSTIKLEQKEKIRENQERWETDTSITYAEKLDVEGSYASSGNGVAQPGVYQNREPDPSAAVNYWKNILNPNDYIYPKDEKTGLPLGAWPKNYGSIPTQLSTYKTYGNAFIWPVTPVKGVYQFVYQHTGMDIMAYFGEPIYSPVNGVLEYSEWGHTSNQGGDETAYSLSIKLTEPVVVNGKTISTIFFTHMSGIRYRCARGRCNRTVRKGELLGFVGNAAGSAESVGWAPHLHATYYPEGNYGAGLNTTAMENLYNVPNYTKGYNIVAGG